MCPQLLWQLLRSPCLMSHQLLPRLLERRDGVAALVVEVVSPGPLLRRRRWQRLRSLWQALLMLLVPAILSPGPWLWRWCWQRLRSLWLMPLWLLHHMLLERHPLAAALAVAEAVLAVRCLAVEAPCP